MVTEKLKVDGPFDLLGDVLNTLRFRGSIFFTSELAAPWGMALEETDFPRFHVCLSGKFFVGSSAIDALEVHAHSIVALPGGESHWIADQPGRELIASQQASAACELGDPLFQQGQITNRVMCGRIHYDHDSRHPLIDSLPNVLHFPNFKDTSTVWQTVQLIDNQLQSTSEHHRAIIDRLAEVLFLQLLENDVMNSSRNSGFLAAINDIRVSRALTLIHQSPETEWTLATLGRAAGMSRATLTRRFQDVLGMSPMAYLSEWRLMKAHELVNHSAVTLEMIAERTGFASARTLSRAYKRYYGCTPHEMRQRHRNG